MQMESIRYLHSIRKGQTTRLSLKPFLVHT